jgi:hypothetical protein
MSRRRTNKSKKTEGGEEDQNHQKKRVTLIPSFSVLPPVQNIFSTHSGPKYLSQKMHVSRLDVFYFVDSLISGQVFWIGGSTNFFMRLQFLNSYWSAKNSNTCATLLARLVYVEEETNLKAGGGERRAEPSILDRR